MNIAVAFATAGTLILGAVGFANAASLQIVNGTAATIPSGSEPDDVPIPTPFGPASTLEGFTNASIELDGEAMILVEYFGKEAGWTNSFSLGGDTITTEDDAASATALSSFTTSSLSAGTLAFDFRANGTPITNGSANDVIQFSPNFFASVGGNPTGTSGDSVWLLLDDGGGQDDDNDYDDMVVRLSVTAVPAPASILLLGTAIAGLAARRLRAGRSKVAATA